MMDRSPWRSVRSVMLATLQVAVVACSIRTLLRPSSSTGSVVLALSLVIPLSVILTRPIGRMIASAFGRDDRSSEADCPRCGRCELRPLLQDAGGIFQPVSGYRCASCWTTFRQVGDRKIEVPGPRKMVEIDSSGIEFVEPLINTRGIHFLDEPEKYPT